MTDSCSLISLLVNVTRTWTSLDLLIVEYLSWVIWMCPYVVIGICCHLVILTCL